jgi:hypothetical protein
LAGRQSNSLKTLSEADRLVEKLEETYSFKQYIEELKNIP